MWWGSFVFLLPLFLSPIVFLKRPLQSSFIWSCMAYMPHIICFTRVIYDTATAWYAYLLVIGIIFIFFIPTVIWFYVLAQAVKTPFYDFIFFVTAVAYSWWLCYVVFLPVGYIRGYPLVFPLLPFFVAFPFLTKTIWCGGKFALLGCVYAAQISSVRYKKNILFFVPIVAGWLCISLCIPEKQSLENIISVACPVYAKQGLQQLAYAQQALRDAVKAHTQALAFILPESVIPFDYEKIPYMGTLLTDEVGIRQRPIVFGTQECKDGKAFNSVGVAHNGRITIGYVKKRLVPFFECFHPLEIYCKKSLILQDKMQFYPGFEQQEVFLIPGVGYCIPLVCSECLWIFPCQSFPVLVLVHDGHFKFSYFKRLIHAYAMLQAGVCNVPLIYSSYVSNL